MNLYIPVTADYVAFIDIVYRITVWGNYTYEALPFLMSLCFNKLFREELAYILGIAKISESNHTEKDSKGVKKPKNVILPTQTEPTNA